MSDICVTNRRYVPRLAALSAGAALVLAGCSADPSSPAPSTGSTYAAQAKVVQPGRPGEPATTLAPGQVGHRPAPDRWNAADVRFVQMMVRHHAQALRMGRLADQRSADPRVRSLARRVGAVQAPEIQMMTAWLTARGQKTAEEKGHAHRGAGERMIGEVSAAQLDRLAARSGAAFDRLFLELMIAHHAGAMQMAEEVTASGTDPAVQEMAAEISSGQAGEIRRMEQVLSDSLMEPS